MPVVKIPTAYRGPTHGVDRIEVEGTTVRECIEAVEKQYPGFGPLVLDGKGAVHRFVSIGVNGNEIDRADVDTEVSATDVVDVMASVSGG